MRSYSLFAARILLICLPQFLLSLAAILCYVRAGVFPRSGIGAHLFLILTLQVAYFSAWGLLVQRWREPGAARGLRIAFALSGLIAGAMINLVYLASHFSYQFWGAYVSWANLQAIGPHLRGFQQALGSGFALALGFIGAVFLGSFLLLTGCAGFLLRWLRSSCAPPRAALHSLVLGGGCLAATLMLWLRDPHWQQTAERDPVLAFWTNRAASEPTLTPAMLADRAAAESYRVPVAFHRRNVIIISIDCLRADRLSFRGYPRETTPFLTSLATADRLHAVDFAVSNGNDSPLGIRTILGSRYPHQHNIHNFRLQDLLGRAGYRTHVIGTGDHSTLGNMRMFYGPNVDVFLDGLTHRNFSVNDDRGLIESLDSVPAFDGHPAFFFFHLMSAHALGVREPRFARWQPAAEALDWNAMLLHHYDADVVSNTYDNGLLRADHYLGQVFRLLETKGYLQDYVAVITGDHGEGLGERGNFGHTRFLYAEDVTVPILFLESSPAAYGRMPFGSHVDIAPTLLDRLGLPKPERWAGQSLYRAPAPALTYLAGTRNSGWRAVLQHRDGRLFKYLFYGNTRRAFREHLYEVSRDPQERQDLIADRGLGDLLEEMRGLAAREFGCLVPPAS